MIGKEIDDKYIENVKAQVVNQDAIDRMQKDITIIYTPLHGTGNIPARRVMKELGFGYGEVEKRGIVSPVAGVSVSYKKPVLFDDVVEISVSVKKYSGVVLELAYEFFNVTRSEVCTEASSKHCFTRDGELVSLKREIPELDVLFRSCVKGD